MQKHLKGKLCHGSQYHILEGQ